VKRGRSRLKTVAGRVPAADTRVAKVPEKEADELYSKPAYREWREIIVRRAGWRCEAIEDNGYRCERRSPAWRMYADHIREVKDGGAEFDLANGQCLCPVHHALKTNVERAKRAASVGRACNGEEIEEQGGAA
jgi:5-methylcytosine-specific restriction protein A